MAEDLDRLTNICLAVAPPEDETAAGGLRRPTTLALPLPPGRPMADGIFGKDLLLTAPADEAVLKSSTL